MKAKLRFLDQKLNLKMSLQSPLLPEPNGYGAVSSLSLAFLAIEVRMSNFNFSVGNYWQYSLCITAVLGFVVLRHVYKNAHKYGVLTFFTMMGLLPLLMFFVLPQAFHKLHIVSTKDIYTKGIVYEKYYIRKADNPYVVIKTNLAEHTKVKKTIRPYKYNQLKLYQQVKVIGTLSRFGFDFKDIQQ